MEQTLDRGRWSSVRVARIYINDGLAKEIELEFGKAIQDQLKLKEAALSLWLQRQ